MSGLPECPPSLKQIQHILKIAAEHETRNPVVCYWCQFYALQTAIPLKANDNKAFLLATMDHLEESKKLYADNEAITSDVVAQAHIENYALKLFAWADTQDRQSNFGKNVVKSFYTAGMLFDVLTTFGELSEEIQQNQKYAKWKAAYIHNCLKNGETPVPGPMQHEGEVNDDLESADEVPQAPGEPTQNPTPSLLGFNDPSRPVQRTEPSRPPSFQQFPHPPFESPVQPPYSFPENPSPRLGMPVSGFFNIPQSQPLPNPAPLNAPSLPDLPSQSGVKLTPEQMTKAQKYCKYAGSALNYDDVPTAIAYLEKALRLCKTGVDIS